MNTHIPLKDFRQNVAKYEKRVQKGDSFVITRRSRPLFRISPVEGEDWETVVDFTAFRKGGLSAKELLERLNRLA